MPKVPCPECDTEGEVRPGGRATCPECGARVRADDEPQVLEAVEDDAPRGRPRRRSRPKGDSPYPCPECGSRWVRKGPWPWYLGTVGAFMCKAMECQECGHEFDAYKPDANLGQRKLFLALAINGVGLIGIIIVLSLLFLEFRALNR